MPSFLPSTPTDRLQDGKELIRYHRIGNRYRLYSVGVNGIDEGGAVAFRLPGERRIDRNAGDLVWSFEELNKGE
ncbi:MAG: hypothetical protein P1U87_07695 [Verrucomicrobiales bacterium]|nr:hypothetical protein [Verrucomicrobiales bacterium]